MDGHELIMISWRIAQFLIISSRDVEVSLTRSNFGRLLKPSPFQQVQPRGYAIITLTSLYGHRYYGFCQYHGLVSDPNGRGTAGLITSCVATLCLCGWSALHLNIPQRGGSRRAYWVRNLQWIFLGLIIPELVILSAWRQSWRQWASTRELHQQMGRVLESDEEGFGPASVSGLDTNPSQNVYHNFAA